jgi:hypothetical protein
VQLVVDTPKHASWLNMAEIKIGFLGRLCLAWLVTRSNEGPGLAPMQSGQSVQLRLKGMEGQLFVRSDRGSR